MRKKILVTLSLVFLTGCFQREKAEALLHKDLKDNTLLI